MTEQTTITFQRYRTPQGIPTCAANFLSAPPDACLFVRTVNYGTMAICAFCEAAIHHRPDGYLEPLEQCPIWGSHA